MPSAQTYRFRVPPIARLALVLALALAVLAAFAAAPGTAAAKRRQADRDHDGLSDRYEIKRSRTNPRRKDTDRDGLRDRYELKRSRTKPRRRDTDGDGLGDGFELRRSKTNPRRRDTDNDGISDAFEGLQPVSDPIAAARRDSDRDGLSNSYENSRSHTDPYSYDTDGDGYGDGAEVAMGTNPRDPNSPLPPPVSPPPPDTTAPDTSISAGPSGSTTQTSASFSFNSSESGSTLECKLDSGSWAACTSPKAYSSLATGSHTFSARAKDSAGNVDASPATRTWTVEAPPPPPDTTAPDTSISAGPSGSTTQTSASFSFNSSESGSTLECKLDSGSWAACTSPKAYSSLATGSHTFSARAKDSAGNADASPATRTWTVEAPPPPPPPPSGSHRDIPVSPAGYLGNFNLTSRSYVVANRFVLDQDRTIDRWYANVVGEGTDCVGGRTGYGDGNGGTLWGRIVEVDQTTGMPTGNILGQEQVNGCTSWQRAKNEFGLVQTHAAHYFQFPAVTLRADRMYAFLLSNVDSNPGSGTWNSGGDNGNHMSTDHNFAPLSQMGPNGRNNLDPNASGAMYGLDPRETTMWSGDGGNGWKFGDQVGWYQNGNGMGRMWTGAGYRIAGTGENVAHGWPYNNDPGEGPGTVTFKSVPKATTITRAGGSSSSGNVGVVTVKNLRTGVQGQTPSLGSGVQRGTLSTPVPVEVGDSYTVTNTGVVDTGDGHRANVFQLGRREPFMYSSTGSKVSQQYDMPMLFASPHPYF